MTKHPTRRPVTPLKTRQAGFVLLVAHEPKGWHDWVYITAAIEMRDWLGRRLPVNSMGGYEWLRIECNNTSCPAIALVRLSRITDQVEEYLPVPATVWPDSTGNAP